MFKPGDKVVRIVELSDVFIANKEYTVRKYNSGLDALFLEEDFFHFPNSHPWDGYKFKVVNRESHLPDWF